MSQNVNRIYWSKGEKEAVAFAAYSLFAKSTFVGSFMKAVFDTQANVLRPERVRPNHSLYNAGGELETLGRRLYNVAMRKIERDNAKNAELAVQQESIPQRKTLAEIVRERNYVEPTPAPAPVEASLDSSIEVLVEGVGELVKKQLRNSMADLISDSFANQLKSLIEDQVVKIFDEKIGFKFNDLHQQLEEATNRFKSTLPQPPSIFEKGYQSVAGGNQQLKNEIPPKKKKVLVTGLQGGQQTELKSRYGNDFDFVFSGDHPSGADLKVKAKNCDLVFITKFGGHSVQEALRDHPGLNMHVKGLTEIFSKLEAAK